MHDEWGLDLTGLLVGVGHQATDKVGFAAVLEREKLDGMCNKEAKLQTRVDISSPRETR